MLVRLFFKGSAFKVITLVLYICTIVIGISFSNSIIASNCATYDNENSIYQIIEKFSYNIQDEVVIKYHIETNHNVVSIDHESNGFSVIKEAWISRNEMVIAIKVEEQKELIMFELIVNLDNGNNIKSTTYGFIDGDYIYINANSYDAAKDIMIAWQKGLGKITDKEYEKIMMSNYKSTFEENNNPNKTVVKATKSSSGGWVIGTLRWQDDWGNWHPLQFTKISIYDEDPIFDDCLGTVYTNEDGDYTFSFDDNIDDLFDSSGRDIYIKIWPAGTNSTVKTGTNNEYFIRTITNMDVVTGSITTINVDINMNSDLGRAFQVSQAIITIANYASIMRGSSMENVTVRYPHNETSNGCFYNGANETIYIVGNRAEDSNIVLGQILHSYASWDVIMHEYGHFVQDMLNIEDNPGGSHWITVNMYDHYMSHHTGGSIIPDCGGDCANPSASNAKDRAIKITYAESWPSVFGAMSQQYFIDLGVLDSTIITVGDEKYDSYNGSNTNYNSGLRAGEAVESSIMGVLWDIYDNDSESYDTISLGHYNWWNLTVVNSPKTFSQLASCFYSQYTSHLIWEKFDRLLEYYKMSPQNITISDTIVSHAAPTISWVPNGTSTSLLNNHFRVMVYDSSYSLLCDYYTNNTSITISQEQWSAIISSTGEEFFIRVGGSQTNGTSTGYYYSGLVEFKKPKFQTALVSGSLKITGYYDWTPSSLSIQGSYNGISLTAIGANAFYGFSSLTDLSLPDTIITIDTSAFENCSNIESIIIPYTTLDVGNNAFKNCSSLNSIRVNRGQAPLTTLGANAFNGCSSSLQITVPINRIADYKNKTGWGTYRNKIIPDSTVYTTVTLNSTSDFYQSVNLEAGFNKIYKLSVNYLASYRFTANSLESNTFKVRLYDSNMALLSASSKTITEELNVGYYYLSVEFDSSYINGDIQVNFKKYMNHSHSYGAPYLWYDFTKHIETCSCGATRFQGHAVSPDALGPGQQYATCLICGGLASIGIIGPTSLDSIPRTINGSYILPNGVVVLATGEIYNYVNGTLLFYTPEDCINLFSNITDALKRKKFYPLDEK